MTKVGWISQEIRQQGLVIATQAHRAIVDKPGGQQIDDGLRIRTAIYVIAQINLERTRYWPASDVIINACNGLDQQIGPTGNITNGIDARICRRRSGKRSR